MIPEYQTWRNADELARLVKDSKGAGYFVDVQASQDTKDTELASALHTLMHTSFNKGDFAASIFENVAAGETIACPKYIADALMWLQDQLEPTTEVLL